MRVDSYSKIVKSEIYLCSFNLFAMLTSYTVKKCKLGAVYIASMYTLRNFVIGKEKQGNGIKSYRKQNHMNPR